MIYAVCGPASLLSTLVVNVARALLERVHGEIFFHHTNDANDLRNRMASGNLRDGLITFDVPDHIISQLILRSRTPTILVHESMAAIYVFNRHAFGMDYLGASRQISRIFSVFRPLFDAPNVLILNMTEDQSFERLVGRVASGLHLNVSEEDVNSVMVRVAENFAPTATIRDVLAVTHHLAQDVFDGISNLPVDERRTLVTLEQGYGRLLSQKEMPALKWPTELLINAENSSQVSSPLDLTGPGRLLTFGPYMCLPIGEWRAQVALALKDNLSNNIFMCDIYSPSGDEPLAVGRVDLPVGGYFKTSLNFTVKSASDAFEFRTFMPTGAIEGVLEIIDITMHLEN